LLLVHVQHARSLNGTLTGELSWYKLATCWHSHSQTCRPSSYFAPWYLVLHC